MKRKKKKWMLRQKHKEATRKRRERELRRARAFLADPMRYVERQEARRLTNSGGAR